VSGLLRAVLVLSHTGKSEELIITRYATVGVVYGGLSKLCSYVERECGIKRLIVLADRSISEGTLYKENNFTLDRDRIVKPDYSFYANPRRVSKYIKWIKKQPYRIYDSGSDLYVRTVN
jgi:hypothetical protein